ncbi:tRNA (adenosine(37)-N6)-dimethylallyltransferase MiaA [Oceanibaculum indicum]|uniref:tRNA dimethylallyltransferase n=1 Tax=Oceanibaculum indicum TaxID=526216 RepID=A0A420WHB1_9PROT|nr:tRNA (adenosine(37)-N6)-dimethylallyltransferase MiaA [Oceanibaculum indicum]RKQ70383.1 tRNA dimethylallyltransferase [Oceanibaculum indicum]
MKVPVPLPVIVVAGPTASGKSALAVEIAEAFRGVVINADSMQVYADLRVLTARPSEVEERRVPHRLYGVLDGSQKCSAGRWRELALAEIARVHASGQLPVLCGGTGLYLQTLMRGIAPVPAVPASFRAEATALHAQLGGPGFHERLAERDPVMAARLHPGNTQRLIRAWEVLNATGRSLADWQAAPRAGAATGLHFLSFVLLPARAPLYAACDGRFMQMLEMGALEEVRALVARGLDPALPVMKALGVRELAAHLAGELTLEEAIDQAQRETRRYAKRQVTWFRHQMEDAMIFETGYGAKYSASPRDEIFSKIRQSGLTAKG